MNIFRWAMGMIVLGIILSVIILRPLPFLFHHDLPYAAFFGKAFYVILLSSLMCLWRVLRGPTAPDRIVAMNTLGIMLVGLCGVLAVVTGRAWYIDIGIAWALQAFVTILALSKYLEGKGFDE
jgi:multicomponent Na+:H+ antiporter subunit F